MHDNQQSNTADSREEDGIGAQHSNTYPYPSELGEAFSDEEEYVGWLVDVFERVGWECNQEVTSDSGECRADIIAHHDKWGNHGIECKYKSELRPRVWAQALQQVERYSETRFNGNKIDNWAIAAFESDQIAEAESQDDYFDLRQGMGISGYREFMNCMGYGILRHQTRVELIYNNSNPMVKIPIAEIEYPSGNLEPPSIRRLRECDTNDALEYVGVNDEQ